jgi:acyl dehydratase
MSLLVADGQRLAREAAERGEEVAVWGPSPGFRDLRWIRPVLAGDTVSYANVVIDKRTSASRPGWGILTARTTGTNQRGEEVYAITASAFVPLRVKGA